MNKFLVIPCVASLFVFATVVMVRGSQSAKEAIQVRSVSSSGNLKVNQPLLSHEAADEAVLAGWPSESRIAFFSRRGPTSTLSANTQWHFADLDDGQWQAHAFIGELVVHAQTQSAAEITADSEMGLDIDLAVPRVQQLPICVDRVTGKIGIHADGQWQPYQPWLAINLPKLKQATGFGEGTPAKSLSMLH